MPDFTLKKRSVIKTSIVPPEALDTLGDFARSPLLQSLHSRLEELEDEHRLCGGTPVTLAGKDNATFAKNEVNFGVQGIGGGGDEGVYRSDAATQNMELKGSALEVLTTAKRRSHGIIALCDSGMVQDRDAVTHSTQCAGDYQDRFVWLKGSQLTLEGVLEKIDPKFSAEYVASRLASLPENAETGELMQILDSIALLPPEGLQKVVDDPLDRSALSELKAEGEAFIASRNTVLSEQGGDEVSGPSVPTSNEILGALEVLLLQWEEKAPKFLDVYGSLLSFTQTNPKIDLEKMLRDGQAKMVSSERVIRTLNDKYDKLLRTLQQHSGKKEEADAPANIETSRIALELISTAEERARVMEESMAHIRKRWACIEQTESDLHSVAWPEVDPMLESLHGLSKDHTAAAATVRADIDLIEKTAANLDQEESKCIEELENAVYTSQREIDVSVEVYEAKWKEMRQNAKDLIVMFDDRVRLINRHCEMVEESHQRTYDNKIRDELTTEHTTTLENLESRHLCLAEKFETLAEHITILHEQTLIIRQEYISDGDALYQADADIYETVLENYCRLVGDLLSRRRNRVGIIDIEGTILKMKIDGYKVMASEDPQTDPGSADVESQDTDKALDEGTQKTEGEKTLQEDIARLECMKREKRMILAYIATWCGRLDAQISSSKAIISVCPEREREKGWCVCRGILLLGSS